MFMIRLIIVIFGRKESVILTRRSSFLNSMQSASTPPRDCDIAVAIAAPATPSLGNGQGHISKRVEDDVRDIHQR